jgi:hypothetical protein
MTSKMFAFGCFWTGYLRPGRTILLEKEKNLCFGGKIWIYFRRTPTEKLGISQAGVRQHGQGAMDNLGNISTFPAVFLRRWYDPEGVPEASSGPIIRA